MPPRRIGAAGKAQGGSSGRGLRQPAYACSNRALDIIAEIDRVKPRLAIVDSVQTVYLEEANGTQGSVSQVRECTSRLMRYAKSSGVAIILVGHVTKEGVLAGPKVLEHLVDTVLYFEGG